jgi:2-polyprenyl-3-methyl-5-hydroxy-6-metoxy-1,4-benzoquinol methylase
MRHLTDMSHPTDRTQGFFHQYASDFDAIYSNRNGLVNRVVNHFFRGSMRVRFVKSIEGCDPVEDKTVLDIGCGPGHYAISLATRGAARALGIDFAGGMLEIARQHAELAGVGDRCEFRAADFFEFSPAESFDYTIAMGFMDYMPQPREVVAKVLSLTRNKAFFSFPAAGGLLAWQRKLRYRNRCELFLYTRKELEKMFSQFPGIRFEIERIDRDFFVTASVSAGAAAGAC